VVLLEIDTLARTGLTATPFSDISATLSHGGTTVSFFNRYNCQTGSTSFAFPPIWYIPNFWGNEVGGTYTLYIEDHEHSGALAGIPFDLVEWCLTPLDPASTPEYVTSGTWAGTQTGPISDYDTATRPTR
jgi:hypothetical protein